MPNERYMDELHFRLQEDACRFYGMHTKRYSNYMPGTNSPMQQGKDVMKVNDKLVICSLGRAISVWEKCAALEFLLLLCPLSVLWVKVFIFLQHKERTPVLNW